MNAADISRTRVENAKDVVKRDQQVWVKVISTAGGRLRLSMRDVVQKTGKDLVPMTKPGEGAPSFVRTSRLSMLLIGGQLNCS